MMKDWMPLIFVGALILGLYLASHYVEPSSQDIAMICVIGLIAFMIIPQVI